MKSPASAQTPPDTGYRCACFGRASQTVPCGIPALASTLPLTRPRNGADVGVASLHGPQLILSRHPAPEGAAIWPGPPRSAPKFGVPLAPVQPVQPMENTIHRGHLRADVPALFGTGTTQGRVWRTYGLGPHRGVILPRAWPRVQHVAAAAARCPTRREGSTGAGVVVGASTTGPGYRCGVALTSVRPSDTLPELTRAWVGVPFWRCG